MKMSSFMGGFALLKAMFAAAAEAAKHVRHSLSSVNLEKLRGRLGRGGKRYRLGGKRYAPNGARECARRIRQGVIFTPFTWVRRPSGPGPEGICRGALHAEERMAVRRYRKIGKKASGTYAMMMRRRNEKNALKPRGPVIIGGAA